MEKCAYHQKLSGQFDSLASSYDALKEKNIYYFETLKKLFQKRITKSGSKIIEIGCATGQILASLKPYHGVGVDISQEMIEIARYKYPSYTFYCQSIENLELNEKFDYVILSDILEYVRDLKNAFKGASAVCSESGIILVTSLNILWAPLLKLAQQLKLKMPDKFNIYPAKNAIIKAAGSHGLHVAEYSTHLLCPKRIPGSDYINRRFGQIPLLNRFGMIMLFVFKKRNTT